MLNSIITLLSEHWDYAAACIGLTSIQLVVVSGMVMSGMIVNWTFQHEQHHHHD